MIIGLSKIEWSLFGNLEVHAFALNPYNLNAPSNIAKWRIKLVSINEIGRKVLVCKKYSHTNSLLGRCLWNGPTKLPHHVSQCNTGIARFYYNYLKDEFIYIAIMLDKGAKMYIKEGNLNDPFSFYRIAKIPYLNKPGTRNELDWEDYNPQKHAGLEQNMINAEVGITRTTKDLLLEIKVEKVWANIYGLSLEKDLHLLYFPPIPKTPEDYYDIDPIWENQKNKIYLECINEPDTDKIYVQYIDQTRKNDQHKVYLQYVDPIRLLESGLFQPLIQDPEIEDFSFFENYQIYLNYLKNCKISIDPEGRVLFLPNNDPLASLVYEPQKQIPPLSEPSNGKENSNQLSSPIQIPTYQQNIETNLYPCITPEESHFSPVLQTKNNHEQSDSEFSNLTDIIPGMDSDDALFLLEK